MLMKLLTPILFPFAVLYDAATRVRNRLYDTGIRPSSAFDLPVISVGNLSVGGTGKTPMIEYLIRLLDDEYRLATLSRGYGRKTRGIRIAGDQDNAETVGDEPFQFFRKFGDRVVVAVGEERAFAIPRILDEHPETEVILLDDAFQHRRVRPCFQILLTDYHRLFVNDLLLPAGSLRESRQGAARADVIVVTKCPDDISEEKMMAIEKAVRHYSNRALFFARIGYGNLLSVGLNAPYKPEKVTLVSGIASPAPLLRYLRKNYDVVKHFSFPDHHRYSEAEMRLICKTAVEAASAVVTTEKDLVKLDPAVFEASSVSLYYLPIEVEFLKNGKEFDEMVLNAARSHAR